MAVIWAPGTFFEDVWTYKISALYLLYFQSYETFSDVLSDFHLLLHDYDSTGDRELKFFMSKHLQNMCLETKFQPFLFINNRDIG